MSTFLLLLAFACLPVGCTDCASHDQARAPDLDRLFANDEGWIGADGAYSCALPDGSILWLFSDTWIGSVLGGKRHDATIINNSVGVQRNRRNNARIEFFWKTDADQKPRAIIAPPNDRGWFWLRAGVVIGGKLHVFLGQIEKTGTDVFGFRELDVWLGVVENPLEDPRKWHWSLELLPFTSYEKTRSRSVGAAALKDGDYVYIYGVDADTGGGETSKHATVARVDEGAIGDPRAWRFYDGDGWTTDFDAAARLFEDSADELSVTFDARNGRYVAVYTEGGLSARILARTAPKPSGPWSAPTLLYECLEMGTGKGVFTYAAKAHTALSSGESNELVVSYLTNSFDFWEVAANAELYRPRFLRVIVPVQ